MRSPELDDRFCPSCGSFEVDLKTPAEIADEYDIAKVARWAAIAVLERKDFCAKGVNSQTGEEMLKCLL